MVDTTISFPRVVRARAIGWIMLCLVASVSPLFAALGDTPDSVRLDQAQMKASLKIIPGNAYTIYEMTCPNGTVVREYVSGTAGSVFGVTWRGPFIPDLKQLLGTHFDEYVRVAKAQRETHIGRRPLNIQEPELVVQTAGHMRAFSGRAYNPGGLPAGSNADDIK